MTKSFYQETIESFWEHLSRQNWDSAQKLLHADFVAWWPQSKIRFDGPEKFIGMNRAYPGQHNIQVLRVSTVGDGVISEVEIKSIMPDGQRLHLFAISFFEFEGDKIIRATEYWADTYEAPRWQLQFAVRKLEKVNGSHRLSDCRGS